MPFDGIDSFTKLMLHCDGSNNGTVFIDSSFSSKTVTVHGVAKTVTSEIKFGTASFFYNNDTIDNALTLLSSNDWRFGSEDFTVDFWFKPFVNSGDIDQGTLLGDWTSDTGLRNWKIDLVRSSSVNSLIFQATSDGNATYIANISGNTSDIFNWHHYAIVRNNNNLYLFVDGISLGTYSISGTINSGLNKLTIGASDEGQFGGGVKGYFDEVRISKGIARWTSNFTPNTTQYIIQEDIDEGINISDSIDLTDTVVFYNENISIDESIDVQFHSTFPVINAKEIISYNPLLIVSEDTQIRLSVIDISDPDNPLRTTFSYLGVSNASRVTIDEILGFIYISCGSGKILKINKNILSSYSIIDVSDSDNLNNIELFPNQGLIYLSTNSLVGEAYLIDQREVTLINTSFSVNLSNVFIINTNLPIISSISINTSLSILAQNKTLIKTNFPVLSSIYNTIEPISREDWHVYINNVELANDDINLKSITITHTIDQQSVATFILARRHDQLNKTLSGETSEITNQNNVKIYIKDVLEFDGKIGELDCSYQKSSENVTITSYMEQPTENYNNVSLPLPGLNEPRHLYHIIIQNPKISNPYINPSLDYSRLSPKKYLGIKMKLGTKTIESIQKNSIYLDFSNGTGNLRYNSSPTESALATAILNGTFKPVQNYTYFWFVDVDKIGLNFSTSIIGFHSNTNALTQAGLSYIGTSLSGLGGQLYKLNGCSFFSQREFTSQQIKLGDGTITVQEIEDEVPGKGSAIFSELITRGYINGSGTILNKFKYTQGPSSEATNSGLVLLGSNLAAGFFFIKYGQSIIDKVYNLLADALVYTVGSPPYKSVSSRNGVYIATEQYSDEANGLYIKTNDSYNYVDFVKKIAELEYKKLINSNGDIFPDTSLGINLTLDAYYFYKLRLLTRINIANTTEANIFNNQNGFPVAIKTITLNSSSGSNGMQVALNCDNKKSTKELETIDGQFPDENDPLYFYPGYSYQRNQKFDLQSGERTS